MLVAVYCITRVAGTRSVSGGSASEGSGSRNRGEGRGLWAKPLSRLPGSAYVQGRYGFAVGTTSAGDLWLKNANGVILHLIAKRQGLMLSLGGDAVVIRS